MSEKQKSLWEIEAQHSIERLNEYASIVDEIGQEIEKMIAEGLIPPVSIFWAQKANETSLRLMSEINGVANEIDREVNFNYRTVYDSIITDQRVEVKREQ